MRYSEIALSPSASRVSPYLHKHSSRPTLTLGAFVLSLRPITPLLSNISQTSCVRAYHQNRHGFREDK